MKLGRARILHGDAAATATSALRDGSPLATDTAVDTAATTPRVRFAQRLPAQEFEAHERARAIVARAEERAAAIVHEAERAAAQARLHAEAQGRADAAAALAAQAIALRAHESSSADRQLDQLLALARVLAERILGDELRLAPDRIADLARQALTEARGARQISIEAHPDDVPALESALGTLAPHAETVRVVPVATRARSSLKIVTDVGVLDADLSPQLERLTQKLRETLKHE